MSETEARSCLCKRLFPLVEDRESCPIHRFTDPSKPYWDGGKMEWRAKPLWPSQRPHPVKPEAKLEQAMLDAELTEQRDGKPTLPVGVSVLLVDSANRILLGERMNNTASGMFSTPGGRIELDEDMVDCAIRETKEETGLIVDAEDVRIIGFKEHFRYGNHYVMFYAEVRRWSGTLTNTEPHKCKEWQWFSLSEIPENCTEPKDILAKLTEPASRLAEVTAQLEESHESLQSAANVVAEIAAEKDALQTKLETSLADQRRQLGAMHDETIAELKRVRKVAAEEIERLDDENATLRAELDRLTQAFIRRGEIGCDWEKRALEAEANAARLTRERDAHEQFLLNHPCGCLDGLTPGEIRLIARFHDRADNLEEDLADANSQIEHLKGELARLTGERDAARQSAALLSKILSNSCLSAEASLSQAQQALRDIDFLVCEQAADYLKQLGGGPMEDRLRLLAEQLRAAEAAPDTPGAQAQEAK
jgi:8-oxo-dGTP diphosphatase